MPRLKNTQHKGGINTTKTEYLDFLTNLQKNFGNEYEISTEKIFNRISILIDNPKTHRPIGFYKLLKIDENTYDLLGFKPFKSQIDNTLTKH